VRCSAGLGWSQVTNGGAPVNKTIGSTVVLLSASLMLTGCDWEVWWPSRDPDRAEIACADIRNVELFDACRELPAAASEAADEFLLDARVPTVVLQGESVRRDEELEVLISVNNPGDVTWNGHVSATFDADCDGAQTEEIIPVRAVTVRAGATVRIQASALCTEMPLGDRRLTTALYGPDPVDLLEETIILFPLTTDPAPGVGPS
jgi:hypothetical protein